MTRQLPTQGRHRNNEKGEQSGALTAFLGNDPNGSPVHLTFGVESAGVPGMNCVITRWWPGADEQTGLLTRIAETLAQSAEHSPHDLDIVVSRRQPHTARTTARIHIPAHQGSDRRPRTLDNRPGDTTAPNQSVRRARQHRRLP